MTDIKPREAKDTMDKMEKAMWHSEEKSIHSDPEELKLRDNYPPLRITWMRTKLWVMQTMFPSALEYLDNKVDIAIKEAVKTIIQLWSGRIIFIGGIILVIIIFILKSLL